MIKYTRNECPAATGEMRLKEVFYLKIKTAFHIHEEGDEVRVVHADGSKLFHYSDGGVCYIIDQKHFVLTPEAMSVLEDNQYEMDSD